MSVPAQSFESALAPWMDAKREELVYDAGVWRPAYDQDALTDEIGEEMERLAEKAWGLEDAIFDVPAANAKQLATKLLIAFDNGRDGTGVMRCILDDCRRFADDSLTRGELSEVGEIEPLVGNHRAWMAERCAALVQAQVEPDDGPSIHHVVALEKLIFTTPAVTDDDVLTRLIMIVSDAAGGGCVNPTAARAVLREAIDHFGLGTLVEQDAVHTKGESR